jgi:hypothetical protein
LATAVGIEGQLIVGSVTVGPTTTAVEAQDAVWPVASFALHVNGVKPTGKRDPDAGTHDVEIGAVPPDTVGENPSTIGEPVLDVPDGAGHATLMPPVICETSAEGALLLPAESYDSTTK